MFAPLWGESDDLANTGAKSRRVGEVGEVGERSGRWDWMCRRVGEVGEVGEGRGRRDWKARKGR